MENPLEPIATSADLIKTEPGRDLFDPQEWSRPREMRVTTINTDTESGKLLVLRAMEKPDYDLAKLAKQTVTVRHVVLFRQEGTIDNGAEVVMKTKIGLVLDDGKILGFASESAIDSFRRIVVEFGGLQNWQPGMQIQICPEDGKAPGPYFIIRRVGLEGGAG